MYKKFKNKIKKNIIQCCPGIDGEIKKDITEKQIIKLHKELVS